MNATLVCVRSLKIGGRQFKVGDELPPGLISPDVINLHLDRRDLVEVMQRRSLHKIFHHFSGSSERERLSSEERVLYTL